MHAVIRRYLDAGALSDAVMSRGPEIRDLLSSVDGFIDYFAVREGDQLTTISICRDRAGTTATTWRAAEWVRDAFPGMALSPPEVSEGEVILHFAAVPTPVDR